MTQENDKIEALLNKSIEELYIDLGDELARQGLELGFEPETDQELEAKGRDWFNSQTELLQSLICNSEIVRKYFTSKRTISRANIVAGLADLIATQLAILPVFTIATLVLKEGIETFCNDHEIPD